MSTRTLAFKESDFLKADFEINHFLAIARKVTSLSGLHRDLLSAARNLKQSLVDLLNRDYEDFISLASNLEGTDEIVAQIKKPLLLYRDQVQSIFSEISSHLKIFDSLFIEREELSYKYKLLNSFLDVNTKINSIGVLLETYDSIDKDIDSEFEDEFEELNVLYFESENIDETTIYNQSTELFNRILSDLIDSDDSYNDYFSKSYSSSVLLERIAYNLKYTINLLPDITGFNLCTEAELKIAEYSSELELRLTDRLYKLLQKLTRYKYTKESRFHLNQSIISCLRAYIYSDKINVAEKMMAEKIINPIISSTLSQDALHRACVTKSGLSTLYTELLTRIRTALGNFLTFTDVDYLSFFDFIGNSIWSEISSALNSSSRVLFSQGLPSQFHTNYRATIFLLDKLLSLLPSSFSKQRFRSNPLLKDFMKSWNLPVYFHLISNEILAVLETECKSSNHFLFLSNSETEPSPKFNLKVTRSLLISLLNCFSDKYWLPELSDRFFKLSLNLISRYVSWVNQSSGLDTVSELKFAECITLQEELRTLVEFIHTDYSNMVCSKFSMVFDDDSKLDIQIRESYDEFVQIISQIFPKLRERSVSIILSECLSILQNPSSGIKSIRSKFFGQRDVQYPTQPSSYIKSCFSRINQMVEAETSKLTKVERNLILRDVCSQLSQSFQSITTEVLLDLTKTSKLLKSVSDVSSSDDFVNNTRLQLKIDLTEFQSEMKSLGFDSNLEVLFDSDDLKT